MPKIELDAELLERIDGHLEEGETRQEFLDEILDIYESEGTFLQEGYSE
jgi:ferritin-like metal-binding protein YciE